MFVDFKCKRKISNKRVRIRKTANPTVEQINNLNALSWLKVLNKSKRVRLRKPAKLTVE